MSLALPVQIRLVSPVSVWSALSTKGVTESINLCLLITGVSAMRYSPLTIGQLPQLGVRWLALSDSDPALRPRLSLPPALAYVPSGFSPLL